MKIRIPFVHNVRWGLATNSSSSHSLVYFSDARPGHDDLDSSEIVETQFGWDQFKLTTRREKLMYALVSTLQREGLNSGWQDETPIPEELRPIVEKFPELESEFVAASNGYIDHQSVDSPEKLFAAALDPKVEIWGGNDNGGDPHEDYTEYDKDYNRIVVESLKPEGLERYERLGRDY